MCYLTRPTSTGLLYVQWLSGKRSSGVRLPATSQILWQISFSLYNVTCLYMPTYNIDAICMDSKFDAWHCLLLIEDNVPGDKIGAEGEVVDSERIDSGILI